MNLIQKITNWLEFRLEGSVDSIASSLPNIVCLKFSAKEYWIVNSTVFFVSTAVLAHGIFFYNNNSKIFASVFFCYLILSFFFKHRPPKSIVANFLTNEIKINARFPDKSKVIVITEIVSVKCLVKPHRFPMTELIFLLKNGSTVIYFFEVILESNGFFEFPREMPDKQVSEFTLMLSNHISLQ